MPAHTPPVSDGQRYFRAIGKWRAAARAAGRSQAEAERAYDMAAQFYDACHAACERLMMAAAAGEIPAPVVRSVRRVYG
jgi:hypothetical protein